MRTMNRNIWNTTFKSQLLVYELKQEEWHTIFYHFTDNNDLVDRTLARLTDI